MSRQHAQQRIVSPSTAHRDVDGPDLERAIRTVLASWEGTAIDYREITREVRASHNATTKAVRNALARLTRRGDLERYVATNHNRGGFASQIARYSLAETTQRSRK